MSIYDLTISERLARLGYGHRRTQPERFDGKRDVFGAEAPETVVARMSADEALEFCRQLEDEARRDACSLEHIADEHRALTNMLALCGEAPVRAARDAGEGYAGQLRALIDGYIVAVHAARAAYRDLEVYEKISQHSREALGDVVSHDGGR